MTAGDPPGDRLDRALTLIDEANAADPETIEFDGVEHPKEQLHADRMTAWLAKLDPAASEAQQLAARAHHLRRWELPRGDYAEGRSGYLRWRTDQKKKHADEVGEILTAVGYDRSTIERVQQIVRKERLKTDPQVQTHEDALCLVFLETQLDALAAELGEEHTRSVLAKTWAKMSDTGRTEALALELSPAGRRLVEEALAE